MRYCAIWYERDSQIGSSMSKYGCTNSPSWATVAGCWNPSAVERTIVFGWSSLSMSEDHAACLASACGMDAFACAANSPPFAVLSAARASSICATCRDAARGERDQQLPRQVGVDLETSSVVSPSRSDCTVAQCSGVEAAVANAVTNCSWLSLPASAACASAHSPSATFARVRLALLGRDVGVRGELQLRERRADRRRLGLAADVAQHEVDVVGRRGLGIPRLIPGRTPHERARERVGDVAEVLDRRLQRAVVEADLRVGEVLVVEQHEVGALVALQLGHLGEVAVDVELDVVHALERAAGRRCRSRRPGGAGGSSGSRPERSA